MYLAEGMVLWQLDCRVVEHYLGVVGSPSVVVHNLMVEQDHSLTLEVVHILAVAVVVLGEQ